MTHEEEIAYLRAENQALREAQSQALAQLSEVQEHLRLALARIEELEKQKIDGSQLMRQENPMVLRAKLLVACRKEGKLRVIK
jgi:hypothetical protein